MRLTFKPVALLLLPIMFAASPAFAGQSQLATASALHQALADQAEAERTQRDAVERVLAQDDVRQLAATMGLSVADARAAVATMNGADLAQAAERANAIEVARAGGAQTVVISLTTLLLVLIIVILLAN